MEAVTIDKEKTVLIESDEVDTLISENTITVTVTDTTSTTVVLDSHGNLVHSDEVKQHVVQGGVQGPPGIPGASNQFEYVIAATVLGGNRAVTTNSVGQLIYPDLTNYNSRIYGVTTHSAQTGELVTVQIAGTQTEPSWNWDVTLPVFVGTNGTLTQIPPTAGQTLVVGYPNSPTKLFIDRQPPIYMG